MPASPWCGDKVTLTTVPPRPEGRNARSAATRVIRSVPPTLSRVTARHPFGSIASAGVKYWPPALLTRTSSRPWRSSAVSTIDADPVHAAGVEDSHNGILAAHAAGLRTIAVPNHEFPPGEEALARADVVLGGLDELTPSVVAGD